MKQINSNIGHYLAGFADGEGSFNVSFRPRNDYKIPWKISLCFNISQREKVILAIFKRYLECGTMRQRRDGIWYFEVNNLNAICENVIPFFKKFPFFSQKKKRDFAKFCKLADMLKNGMHLSKDGILGILAVRSDMNDGGKRKYHDRDILNRIKESPETIRQNLDIASRDDIVRSSKRLEVNTNERS
jgi:hypothetical protein